MRPHSFGIRWPQWSYNCGCAGVEARLAEEDAGTDALCVGRGLDRVLGELCSWPNKAVVSGAPVPFAQCEPCQGNFLAGWMWVNNTNASKYFLSKSFYM